MKKFLLLALGLFAFSVSAQSIEAVETSEVAKNVEIEKVEAVKIEAAETTQVSESRAADNNNNNSAVLERMAMEFFMRQIQNSAKEQTPKAKAPKSNFVVLGFKAGAKLGGQSGEHVLSTIEVGGWNSNKKFMITGEGIWGNRIGGANVNVGMIVPVKENVITLVPGFAGSILISVNEARSSYYYSSNEPEIEDFAFGGAFLKLLFGNNSKVFFDFTNKVFITRSQIREYDYNSWRERSYKEKIGASYLGTLGITLLL